ncbi:MAG: glycoside hydrolase family 2 TIM barrel-domain containing protein [Hallerella porci]|uniref:Glycosyl hydrolase family 2 n=1 Tax=Hallerella porci TaxID=1945871 RepID=A0ABX5LLH8_9BACT|nr:sugar-binding domain-containing protein [Hallerella porci]MDY3922151.1 glycoside hydrolase family 2 TIM barrel-domain containing protein [Hallerella porci]PWL03274.1 glycosyl hydrolase family 2 [Hallerella porci]
MNSIVSLNGNWELLFDTEDTGIVNRWYATYPSGTQKIQVPSVWEKYFSKVSISQDAAFYFKHFTVDAKQISKRIFLRFERISMHATFWLNGKYLGSHFGAYTPCILDLSKAIKPGEDNVLCVRVANMGSANSRIDLGRESKEGADDRFVRPTEMPVGLPWSEYPFGGIYGNVDLILGGAAFITGVQLEPDLDEERIAVDVAFNNPRGFNANLRILMRNPQGEVGELLKENLKLEKENTSSRFVLKINNFKKCVWTPASPKLFAIEIQLEAKGKGKGEPDYSFSVVKNFAFRKFDCIKGDFYLNDSIIKIQGVTYTQHFSEGGLWTADTKKLRKDLEAIKKAGFNTIRSNGAPLTTAALDICDELGLLVFQEFPIYTMRSTPRGLEEVYKLIEEIVMEQKHHPCIAAWILGSENGPLVLENGNKLLNAVDDYDKCRPIISNLNCVYLSNEEEFHKDTGKLMGVTDEKIRLYSSHRLHLRMSPNAALTDFLAHYCDKASVEDEEEISIPDTTLGNSQFQDEYAEFVNDTNGKILVTLKNHTLLPASAPSIKGSRSAKNDKAVKTLYKQLETFVADKKLSIWRDVKSFTADTNRLALQSKLTQINAIQSNPLVSGFMLDQWADFGTDFCGLVDENRNSKGFDAFMQAATTPTRLLVTGYEPVCAPQSEISFQLALLNQARLEDVEIEMAIVDANGKKVSSQVQKAKGQTSLTPLGTFTIVAPKTAGDYKLMFTLSALGEVVSVSSENLLVLEDADVQKAISQVCFLDNSGETSDDAKAALAGPEKIIFTASLSSWNDDVLNRIVELTRDSGKTLFLSDLNPEDIEAFNSSHHFAQTIDSHFTTGANGISVHYLMNNSELLPEFANHQILDDLASSVIPNISLTELPEAKVLARSVSIVNGEIKTGVDLQIIPFGKGRIVFNQLNLFEGLETNPLADRVFAKLVKMLIG